MRSRLTILSSVGACFSFVLPLALQNIQNRPPTINAAESSTSVVACLDPFATSGSLPNGKGCEEELFARRGRPFLFPAHDGVAYGVSANPNNNSALYLWADNRTTQTVRVAACCAMTLFEHIYVFDSLGQRVLSKTDHGLSKGEQMVKVCTCSPAFSIPPYTIQLVDSAEISQEYVLKSGSYTISERFPPVSDTASNTSNRTPEQGLRISIE